MTPRVLGTFCIPSAVDKAAMADPEVSPWEAWRAAGTEQALNSVGYDDVTTSQGQPEYFQSVLRKGYSLDCVLSISPPHTPCL